MYVCFLHEFIYMTFYSFHKIFAEYILSIGKGAICVCKLFQNLFTLIIKYLYNSFEN